MKKFYPLTRWATPPVIGLNAKFWLLQSIILLYSYYLWSLANILFKILWFYLAVTVSQFVTADEIEERGAFGNTNPPFKRIGCPAVKNFQDEGAVKHDSYCFFQNTSCVPNKLDFPDVPKNNNVYRIIRARSWYFCGKNNTKKTILSFITD